MRIGIVHNQYKQIGGEDTVVAQEKKLLIDHGHEVVSLITSNSSLKLGSFIRKMHTALNTIWSVGKYREVRKFIREYRPDVLHIHNTFPLLSPSIYWAAKAERVPVIQTLHNYRLTCANGLLLRDGRACNLCVGRTKLYALRYKCYRDSALSTLAVVAMQMFHKILRTYKQKVDFFLVLSPFAKEIMVSSGIPKSKIIIKPNFISSLDNPIIPHLERRSKMTFVGRISEEKGVDILLKAWERAKINGYTLSIIGDGELSLALQESFKHLENVEWLGWLEKDEVIHEVSISKFVVMASRWYEGLPMVFIEAASVGTPVIAPNHGVFPHLIENHDTGLLYQLDANNLAKLLIYACNVESAVWRQLSNNVLNEYNNKYHPTLNYGSLVSVYQRVLSHRDDES